MTTETAPGPGVWDLVRSMARVRTDLIGLFCEAAREYGDVVRLAFGHVTVHLITHPDDIKRILQDNNKNYGKQTPGHRMLQSVIGNGLLTSEGEFWLRQRRIAQPAFHRERLARFVEVMASLCENMLQRWGKGGRMDIAGEMMGVTMQIVATTMLGRNVGEDIEKINRAEEVLLRHVSQDMRRPWHLPKSLSTGRAERFREARQAIDQLFNAAIAERRGRQDSDDLLSMLMHARDEETGAGMSDEQLRDELATIFIAGHQTTANALAWAFYLLAQNPEPLAMLRRELDSTLGGRAPTFKDLAELKYTRAVFEESMRLYPPAWIIERSVIADDAIHGYGIPAGTMVAIIPFVTHRHPHFWSAPETFLPERFIEKSDRPHFAYLPFGGGPRMCIGNNFAMIEAQIILAMVVARCDFTLALEPPVEMDTAVTLRPRHGIHLEVAPRQIRTLSIDSL
jgi:cytochrome P450